MKKKIDEAQSNKANEALEKLNSELLDVTKILTEDFELMIDRERNLNGYFIRNVYSIYIT